MNMVIGRTNAPCSDCGRPAIHDAGPPCGLARCGLLGKNTQS